MIWWHAGIHCSVAGQKLCYRHVAPIEGKGQISMLSLWLNAGKVYNIKYGNVEEQ